MASEAISRVLVGAKRTGEYLFDALGRLNAHGAQVKLCAAGAALPKCAAVAGILVQEFGARNSTTELVKYSRNDNSFAGLEITLASDGLPQHDLYTPLNNDGFVEYPIYELLLNAYLTQTNEITVEVEDHYPEKAKRGITGKSKSGRLPALVIRRDGFEYKLLVPHKLTVPDLPKQVRSDILSNVSTALYRSGLLLSRSWEDVSTVICRDDDAILGLDTNVLRECIVSQQLLDGLIFHSPHAFVHSPNWLLLIIPNAVMHEIEQLANSRDIGGKLTLSGRLGYRALAEILEIDQSRDLSGISLLVVGEANPVLDARVELRGLRTDMNTKSLPDIGSRRVAAGDTHIRDQFKQFLRQISFHKGTYFLTADKSNNALARAEGLSSVYFAPAIADAIQKAGMQITAPRILDDAGPLLTAPLGKVVFELAVQFGKIWITGGAKPICLEADRVGESLIHWVYKRIRIKASHLKELVDVYNTVGQFSLTHVEKVWHKLNRALMDE